MKTVLFYFLIVLNAVHAQLYLGGQLSYNRKLPLLNYTPVTPQFSNSFEFGITGQYFKNNESKYKASLYFGDDRFQNIQSFHVYNNYLGLCVMGSMLNFNLKTEKKVCLLFGCYAEGLTKYGIADSGSDKFTFSKNIGTNIKFGLATEFAIQIFQNNWISSVSLFTRGDLSRLTILNDNNIFIRDELIRVGLNINLNRQIKIK